MKKKIILTIQQTGHDSVSLEKYLPRNLLQKNKQKIEVSIVIIMFTKNTHFLGTYFQIFVQKKIFSNAF